MRASDVPGDGIRLEVVTSPPVADRIVAHIAQHYFPNYAVIAWVAAVEVVRGEKYV
jgi:nitrogen regulatory protein P-II 2